MGLEDVLQGIGAGLRHLALDTHRPGIGAQRMGMFGGITLASAEFIEIVVARHVL
jgi:hypothetical protein